jgi:hypothetical protein
VVRDLHDLRDFRCAILDDDDGNPERHAAVREIHHHGPEELKAIRQKRKRNILIVRNK